MNVEEFTSFAQSKGWRCVSNGAYGVYNGFPFSAKFQARAGGVIGVSFRTGGKASGKLVRALRKELPMGCSLVLTNADAYSLNCTAPKNGGDLLASFTASMDKVTGAMHDMGIHAPDSCPICKRGGCECAAMLSGAYVPTHRACVEAHGASAQARAEQALRGSYATGFLGAILGGVVGAIPAILCLNFMDQYVAVLYALIPLAAYYGYRICKGKMNSGALVCAILSSIVNMFTVEFFSIFIQLAQVRGAIPTFGFAWRVFLEYTQEGGFIISIITDAIFLGLGLWFTWGQIRVTAHTEVQDAGMAAATLLEYGQASTGYQGGSSSASRPGPAGDPWDR